MTVLYVLLAILIFGVLIFLHEFGHFIAAKRLGVKVNEFSICMGPVLWQRQRGETVYSLRAIPIGGFCAMEGENEASEDPRAFTSAVWWRRLVILAAGSAMNFLAGFLVVIALVSLGTGFLEPKISGFFDGGLLEEQGLRVGDVFYSIDGERVYMHDDVSMLLFRAGDGVHDLVVLRDGAKVRLPGFLLRRDYHVLNGKTAYKYGLIFSSERNKTVGGVLKLSWYQTLDFVRMVRIGLQDLFMGRAGINDMSGPVGIVGVMVDSGNAAPTVSAGFSNIMYLAAFIAVNLAVMNMLPIPALDGGRIFCLLLTLVVEKLSRRKLNPKYEGYLHGAGMLLMLTLMAYITFHDAFKMVRGFFY